MIQLPQTSTQVLSPVIDAPEVNDEVQVADETGARADEQARGTDPIAKFGSMYGLHTQAQQAGTTGAQAKKSPLDAPGLEGGKAWLERGNQLLKQGKYNEAVVAYQEGFRTYPDAKFILNEAAALMAGGRYAEAVLAYERYLTDPQAPRADEARAAMERARSHMKGVEPTITGVHESELKFSEGVRAYEAGKYEEALAAFESAYELNPRPELKYNIAASMDKLGLKYTAIQRYQEYVAEAPQATDRAKVERHIEKLRAQAPTAPITATGFKGAREWMQRGNELLHQRRYDEAVVAFRNGYREYPSEKILLNEAAALSGAGRYAEADIAYSRYLADPDATRKVEAREAQQKIRTDHLGGRAATVEGVAEAGRQFEQGVAHYEAGRYVEALQAFDKAYTLNPLKDTRYNQAAALDKMGQREMAAQRYEQYLAEAPGAKDAGKVQARIVKLRGEVTTLERAAFDRGQEAFLKGAFREAAGAFAEAFSHKPRPEYLFNMATAYEKAGDIPSAIDRLEWYLRIAPDAKDAGAVRAKLAELR